MATAWFQQQGMTKVETISLAGSEVFQAEILASEDGHCLMVIANLDKPEATLSWLEITADPTLWAERRFWIGKLAKGHLSPAELQLWRLWYRIEKNARPPIPALVLSPTPECLDHPTPA